MINSHKTGRPQDFPEAGLCVQSPSPTIEKPFSHSLVFGELSLRRKAMDMFFRAKPLILS